MTADETLVYDLRTNDAHHLDARAGAIWAAADGSRTAAEIAVEVDDSVEVVALTLSRLADAELVSTADRHTRRETLKRSAAGAGALVALPLIASIVAPEAAQAGSGDPAGTPCSTGATCASMTCNTLASPPVCT